MVLTVFLAFIVSIVLVGLWFFLIPGIVFVNVLLEFTSVKAFGLCRYFFLYIYIYIYIILRSCGTVTSYSSLIIATKNCEWSYIHTHTHTHTQTHLYIHGVFNKFTDVFVQAFKIVIDSWKFTMLLLYILWDGWPIFMISG